MIFYPALKSVFLNILVWVSKGIRYYAHVIYNIMYIYICDNYTGDENTGVIAGITIGVIGVIMVFAIIVVCIIIIIVMNLKRKRKPLTTQLEGNL